ncbi:penicillin-binding protein 1C [Helicobacter monodelphidis]|uniref:penicillin-binding protein 1C n=1 Tax=Helicobacter sp. 15-1451 TaxID=2004995 RepID=UPI000DCD34FF|nr:penicillin-binding protein 1C [Helicobacter sp. 15-1451]RAX57058.1 penicillin-binding protein 1C [Helicobacter sp. 15-1451]
MPFSFFVRPILWVGAIVFICIFIIFNIVFWSFNPSSDPFSQRYSRAVLDRNNQILSLFLNDEEQWHLALYTPISEKLKTALILYEDKNFYTHHGIDLLAIGRTLKNNLFYHKKQGASTISMQVIKLLQRNPRNYYHKFIESIEALRLEQLYTKDEILNLYFNNAPYGGNIVGVASAALFYFQKTPETLTWSEAALLAVLPNAPGLINLTTNRHLLQQKRNLLLQKLYEKGEFGEDILQIAQAEPIPTPKIHHNIAPHLALRMIAEGEPEEYFFYSTIDKSLQMRLEKSAKSYQQRIRKEGIHNLSLLLASTETKEILAYIGSQDFFDIQGLGQIDGVRAKRSVGSVLKPLLYALSIDEGLLLPNSLVPDIPLFFKNFNPHNANHHYRGLVPARQALIRSLNVPFVTLLNEYSVEKFYYILKKIIQFEEDNPQRYGLSLILGTKEFTPLDIAKIFVGLGNYGYFSDLTYNIKKPVSGGFQLIQKGSAYLTLQDLSQLERYGEENFYKTKNLFSWKSGTSWGQKDAWAAGVSPQYTLVVWAGNFNGAGSPNLSGAKSAGVWFFEVLKLLPQQNAFSLPPNSMRSILTDNLTHYRLSDEMFQLIKNKNKLLKNGFEAKKMGEGALIQAEEQIAPVGTKILKTSPFLNSYWIYDDGTEALSSDSRFLESHQILRLNLPTPILNFYLQERVDIAHFLRKQEKRTPRFIYPPPNIKITLPKDFSGKKELIVRIANLKKENIFWFLDGNLLTQTHQETFKLSLSKGFHRLFIISESGHHDSVQFRIE